LIDIRHLDPDLAHEGDAFGRGERFERHRDAGVDA
jgi:hypothetical protein